MFWLQTDNISIYLGVCPKEGLWPNPPNPEVVGDACPNPPNPAPEVEAPNPEPDDGAANGDPPDDPKLPKPLADVAEELAG